MKHYFFADAHIFHDNIVNKLGRPFSSPEAWYQFSIDKINERVTKHDILWFMGDLCFGDPTSYRRKLICQNHRLIIGNHDSKECIRSFKGLAWDSRMLKIDNQSFYLSHYPTLYWNKSHYGSIHLYGHTHSQREDTLDSLFPNRRSLDVCPENHFRLFGTWDIFSQDEIIEYLKDRKGHDSIDFYRDYQEKVFKKWNIVK